MVAQENGVSFFFFSSSFRSVNFNWFYVICENVISANTWLKIIQNHCIPFTQIRVENLLIFWSFAVYTSLPNGLQKLFLSISPSLSHSCSLAGCMSLPFCLWPNIRKLFQLKFSSDSNTVKLNDNKTIDNAKLNFAILLEIKLFCRTTNWNENCMEKLNDKIYVIKSVNSFILVLYEKRKFVLCHLFSFSFSFFVSFFVYLLHPFFILSYERNSI